MTVAELIARNARRRPQREALVGEGRRLSHARLAARVAHVAGALTSMGLGRGDRVLVQMANLTPYVELYFAVPLLGAILVPLNVRFTPAELPYYLDHSRASVLVADLPRARALQAGLAQWGQVRRRIVVGGELGGWQSYDDLPPALDRPFADLALAAENDVAYIYYTSGTTGRPKGAMWSHRQVMEHLVNLQLDLPLTPEDTSLVAVNLAHGPSTLPTLHQVLFAGGRVVLHPGPRFEAEEFARTAVAEGATTTLLVPTMLARMLGLEGEAGRWFEGFKYIKYAAAKMAPDRLRRAIELMGTRLTQGYGSTETLGGVTFLAPAEHDPASPDLLRRLASAGKEYFNVQVAIMDQNGALLPPGELGEIVVRSDKNFAGYWQDEEATARAFRDGWLLTGDLGRLDDEDYLYVVDRVTDMIITGGENVYPREVEDVLGNLSGVAESAVVGVPDPEWGEAVWAFVVPAPGAELTAEDCLRHCAARLAAYKKPKHVEVCRALPLNHMGKVQKHLLREQALQIQQNGG
jgi:acyl-CoA synthetase (AMP-forming)/AMP-acid ligase II